MSENELEGYLLSTAKMTGWLAHHIRKSRGVLMGDTGYPDWTLARGGRIVYVELKRETEQPYHAQERWLIELAKNPAVEVYVWRPSDWLNGTITRILGGSHDKTFSVPAMRSPVLPMPAVQPARPRGMRPRAHGR